MPIDPPRQPEPSDRRVAGGSRHVSIRVPLALYHHLESLADDHAETVSQTARRLLSEGLEPPGRNAIDEAITALLLIRRRFPDDRATGAAGPAVTGGPVAGPTATRVPIPSRTVDILNAKTDLQHLIDEVGRGVEIIITHAGARRARLVPIADPPGHVAPIPQR
jgi:prevent-host-death family protein